MGRKKSKGGVMEDVKNWYVEKKAQKAIEALKGNGFDADFFPTGEEAAKKVIEIAASAKTVGVGGSVTVRELKIMDVLEEQGKTILDHWKPSLSPEEILEIRRAQLTCDLFLSGTNALTLNGEIVNIDGTGNRVCAMTFGPKKVVILSGVNKIAGDTHDAVRRIHEVASPMNCRRLGLKAPCGETGLCYDCDSPHRACRITLILKRKPVLTDISVYIIGEEFGF
jgi:hypothetical protein